MDWCLERWVGIHSTTMVLLGLKLFTEKYPYSIYSNINVDTKRLYITANSKSVALNSSPSVASHHKQSQTTQLHLTTHRTSCLVAYRSSEWDAVADEMKEQLGLTVANEGEFW